MPRRTVSPGHSPTAGKETEKIEVQYESDPGQVRRVDADRDV
jgi:hypothetical protein